MDVAGTPYLMYWCSKDGVVSTFGVVNVEQE